MRTRFKVDLFSWLSLGRCAIDEQMRHGHVRGRAPKPGSSGVRCVATEVPRPANAPVVARGTLRGPFSDGQH